MNKSPNPEENQQNILNNTKVGGDLTAGDINPTINNNNSVNNQQHSGSGDNVAGDKHVHNYPDQVRKPIDGIPSNIPQSNSKFVGRAEKIKKLHEKLQENQQLAITAVKGMGGIGKTELALQYALKYKDNDYKGGVCWLRAREENVGVQILNFAENYLGVKAPDNQELELQVGYCWSRWQDVKKGNVLIIIDDITNYQDIQAYLPSEDLAFKVLITTRLNIEEITSIPLDVLTNDDAIKLLKKWVGKDKVNEQIEDVKELCWRLGNLPLALNLVGRYVLKRKITIKELLTRLESKGLSHEALLVDPEKDKTLKSSTLRIKMGVAKAFELSWDELSNEAKYFRLYIKYLCFSTY